MPLPRVLQELIEEYCANVQTDLESRISQWPTDLGNNEIHEVIGSLMARQATLSIEFATSPSIWTGSCAPVLLRTMADTHINLAWILKDPKVRSQQFIEYGLGQIKLQIERRKSEWVDCKSPEDEKYVQALESWLDSQRWSFLTSVNVGGWSGVSTREMAEQAGIVDFYHYVYTPFSAAVHSMWHHVCVYNLHRCKSPLHRYHRVPKIADATVDVYNLYLAAKYVNKSFDAFDDYFPTPKKVKSAYAILCLRFEKLGQIKKEGGKAKGGKKSRPSNSTKGKNPKRKGGK